MKEELNIKDIVGLVTRLQNLCEGFDDSNKSVVLTIKTKILLELSKGDKLSPTALRESVGLAKSNLASICNSMIKSKLIEKQHDSFDQRSIFFCITDVGQKQLCSTLEKMKNNFVTELAFKNNISKVSKGASDLLDLVK